MAAKGSAAMSWRPPLGFRAVVDAIAEHAALEEGEAGPGPQPALSLPEEPSPGFGTSGREEDPSDRRLRGDLPLLRSRDRVLSLRRLSRLLRRESLLLSLRRRLRPLSIPGMIIHGNISFSFLFFFWPSAS